MSKLNQIRVTIKDDCQEFANFVKNTVKASRSTGGTWTVETHGKKVRYTHTTHDDEWKGKAWLVQQPPSSPLVQFQLEPPDGKPDYDFDKKDRIPGVFLGRFVEMLINHCGEKITSITIDCAQPPRGP